MILTANIARGGGRNPNLNPFFSNKYRLKVNFIYKEKFNTFQKKKKVLSKRLKPANQSDVNAIKM